MQILPETNKLLRKKYFIFSRLRDVESATAEGLKKIVDDSFEQSEIDFKKKMVAMCSDGASVNLGVKKGLAVLLRTDGCPWLVAIHCMNHRYYSIQASLTASSNLQEL